MKRPALLLPWFALLPILSPITSPPARAAEVVLSEFMARNDRSLADEDGAYPDWIELHNVSVQPVNLEGWFLTDTTNNLTKWRFPAISLGANEYLIVFASDKNRTNPAAPLHANFQLSGGGEYLGLIRPDGVTVESEYRPMFPPQEEDISYGLGIEALTATPLLTSGAPARVFVPADGTLGAAWTSNTFNDAAWTSGATGVGFSDTGATGGGLYGYWPFREGAGAVAANLVPGGANGSIVGASWVNDPERGTVLSFNGAGNYVAAGTIPRMGQTTSNFTWSFWCKLNAGNTANLVILGNRYGGVQSPLQFIKFTPTNFEYYRGANIGFIPYAIPTGQWLHLAVVKNGSSLTYYANGAVVGTATAGGDIEANPLYFGGDAGGEHSSCALDDISLWAAALTPAQIASLRAGTAPTTLLGYGGLIGTDLRTPMLDQNASAYVRVPFVVNENDTYNTLTLRMKYDDGFVAYLNGVEVARRNAPAAPAWNAAATNAQSSEAALVFESLDISAAIPALEIGTNVLAIHGLNVSASDPDFLVLPELEGGYVQGVGERYFGIPTPRAVNNPGFIAFVADTKFSHDRGFYETNFAVTITSDTPGATIRYTTNGSPPTATNGFVYTAPIPIVRTTVLRAAAFRPGWQPTDVDAQTYLFLEDVLEQTGTGFPTSWAGNTPDYRMDPYVVTNALYRDTIRDDLKSLPVVSLAVDVDEFFGPQGIYANSTSQGVAFERPASAEMFFPDGRRDGFHINCGIRVAGGASRSPGHTPKHGLRLLFKGIYGETKLRQQFFENSEVDRFDTIQFRPNFNMSWVRTLNSGPLNNQNADGAERTHAIYVRDQFTKDSQLAMGSVSAHERFVHLYINGLYWGVYNPSERTDASFDATYFGGEKEEYDAIFSDLSSVSKAVDGDKTAWNTALSLANAGLTTPAQYAAIQEYVDVTNLADYMMLNFYTCTVDWPWQNWNAGRKRAPGAQFKFFVWDAEYTLELPPWVPEDRTGVGNASNEGDSPARLYYQVRQNAEWRLLFADRAQKHFFNHGALTTNQTIPRFLGLCDTIDRAIVGESARWGDVRRTPAFTRADWLVEKERLLTQFFPQRTALVIQQFKAAGLYPHLPAPSFSPPGAGFSNQLSLTLTAPAGTIYYTTNGSDPRLAGGAVAPGALVYSEPIALTASRQVRARAFLTNTWSALEEANFIEATPIPLRLTEIMFNPKGAPETFTNDVEDFEYIELTNIGATPLDLTGMQFTAGITFVFTNRVLPAGESVLVVRNRAAFDQYYAPVFTSGVQPPTVAGAYLGALSNDGERLRLEGALGEVIHDFRYSDWYPLTDGLGFALAIVDPHAPLDTWDQRESWRPGFTPSPDMTDPVPAIPPIRVNEALTHTDPPVLDAIEVFNPTDADVDLGGWFLTDAAYTPMKFIIPSNTVIPAGGYWVFDELDFNRTPGVDPSFALNAMGDQVYLYSGDGARVTGYSHGFGFGAAARGVTFGRYTISTGEEQFPAQLSPTLGSANAGPRTGPVVISEIHYHAADDAEEFIELKNVTDSAVSLYDLAVPTNAWKLAGADFDFPSDTEIPAQGLALLINSNTAANAFRAKHQVPAAVPIFTFAGALQNDGENLELQQPDAPDGNDTPYLVVDAVRYNDRAPWPEAADGYGPSLQRLTPAQYGNDPTNWIAARPSPGTDYAGGNAPVITVQPQPQTVIELTPVTFSVTAAGSGPFAYVWRFNGAPLLGATNADFTIPVVQVADQGTYSVVVLGPAGAVVSAEAGLTVQRVPQIVNQPQGASVNPGLSVTFSVVAIGTGPLTYQWRRNGADVPVATQSVLSVNNAQFDVNDGFYTVVVTDEVGARESEPARLIVRVRPTFTQTFQISPAPEVPEGRTFTFTVSASGSPEMGFRFRAPGVPYYAVIVTDSNHSTVTLEVENAKPALHNGNWDVGITNVAGSVLSPRITVTVVPAPPFFAQHPSNQTATGDTVVFRSEARGTEPIRYQWYFNGSNALASATNATLELTEAQAADEGEYVVVATNNLGAATSTVARLTMLETPIIVTEPADQTSTPCGQAVFSVDATGAAPLAYQWFFNATNLLGNATGPSLTVARPRLADVGGYRVIVANAGGTVTSRVASLTLNLGDCDGDGMMDWWEMTHGLNPGDPADRDLDPDNDRRSNWEEYVSGTDPSDAASVLRVQLGHGGAGGATIRFAALPEVSYTVQYRSSPATGPWLSLTNVPSLGAPALLEINDPNAGVGGSRFYRLVTPMQP